MSLTIALDFDDTYTADPELWGYFINKAQILGHTVICVTARLNEECQHQELKRALPGGISVIFCGSKPKRKHALEEHGIAIDIWLDDYPEGIGNQPSDSEMAAWERVRYLEELVAEARAGRDLAEQKAKQAVQAEMAELRRKLAFLRAGQHIRNDSVREIQGDDCVAL